MRSHHHNVAVAIARDLADIWGVTAVLLHGSVVRGTERPDSDVDLIAVVGQHVEVPTSMEFDGLRAEIVARTESEWLERFDRAQPRWIYPFLEGRVLSDPQGVAVALVNAAHARYENYRTPREIAVRLKAWWEHIQPRQRDVLAHGDELRVGLAGAFHQEIFETVYAVNHRPLPPGGLWLDLIRELPDPPTLMELVEAWLTSGLPKERLAAQLKLLDAIVPLLDRISLSRNA